MLEIYGNAKKSFTRSESVNMKSLRQAECDGFTAFVIHYKVAHLSAQSQVVKLNLELVVQLQM